MNKFYSLAIDDKARAATLYIFGDIASEHYSDANVTPYDLVKQLEGMKDVDTINVRISSYGGEVQAGLAIYNVLKNHRAKVVTYCDSFACSIASVVFMAGDERIMNNASLLMIHNAWTFAEGNAKEMRKMADDLDKITAASVAAYMEHVTLSEVQLKHKMDAETWVTPSEALEWGFATQIGDDKLPQQKYAQSARKRLLEMLCAAIKMEADDDDEDEDVEAPETPVEAADAPGDEEPDDEEENGENGDSEAENDDSNDEDSPDNENDEDPDEPAQKWSGFFNALIRD